MLERLVVLAVLAGCVNGTYPTIGLARQRLHQGFREARRNRRTAGHMLQGRGGGYGVQVYVQEQALVDDVVPGRVVSPLDFPGADPTGVQDSTSQVQSSLQKLLSFAASNNTMAVGIKNLGGATLDLRGGTFRISSPLVIPAFYGNLLITGGTLIAGTSFPAGRFLIEIGESSCNAGKQGCCNEFVTIRSVMLDANHVALGGVLVSNTMGTVITDSFFYGFNGFGVKIHGGHETMVSYSWFAEYYWNEPKYNTSKSVGIYIGSNDNYVTNVIVFSHTHIGVVVTGYLNILSGVHTWNGGGVGIQVGLPGQMSTGTIRLDGCYLDYNTLLAYNPADLAVIDTTFLKTYMVINGTQVHGLHMASTTFSNDKAYVLEGSFTKNNTERLSVQTLSAVGKATSIQKTVATCTASGGNAAWTYDFGDELLFPFIRNFQASLECTEDYLKHNNLLQRPGLVSGTSLTVQASISGTDPCSSCKAHMEVSQ